MRLQLVCLHLSVDLLAVVQSREDVLRLQLAVDKRNLILFIVFFKISLTKLKLILSLKLIVALFFLSITIVAYSLPRLQLTVRKRNVSTFTCPVEKKN